MSASLVGSEMCIRDRSISPCPPSRHPLGSPPGVPPACLPACVHRQVRYPVSYTHLTLPTICSV
eukprot:7477892-Alexandrium_andersonii.AAC.1